MPSTNDILIIDDEATIVDFMTEVLQDEGYSVRSALNGEDGLNEMAATPPALALLDLHMPGMSAIEFLDHVRTDGAVNIPIVIMTAAHHVPEELSTRCVTYLFKPFDLDDLLRCVAQFVHPFLQRER